MSREKSNRKIAILLVIIMLVTLLPNSMKETMTVEASSSAEQTTAGARKVISGIPSGWETKTGYSETYKKHVSVYGVSVIVTDNVSDEALLVAYDILEVYLRDINKNYPKIISTLIEKKSNVIIIGKTEYNYQHPDWSTVTDKTLREGAAGYVCTVLEEDLVDTDSYKSIFCGLVHEFSHTMLGYGIGAQEESYSYQALYEEINTAYEAAKVKYDAAVKDTSTVGYYEESNYDMNNYQEYFAGSAGRWFNGNPTNLNVTNAANLTDREQLAAYDSAIYEVCDKLFGAYTLVAPWGDGSDSIVETTTGGAITTELPEQLAYYTFDKFSTDNKLVLDESGEGYDALLISNPTFTSAKSGNGIVMNGSCGGYVKLPKELTERVKAATIAVDVKLNAVQSDGARLFEFGNTDNHKFYISFDYENQIVLSITNSTTNATNTVKSGVYIAPDYWENIAVTLEDNTAILYVNGIEKARIADCGFSFADLGDLQQNYIGRSDMTSTLFLNGIVDNFSMKSVSMSAVDIKSAYGLNGILTPVSANSGDIATVVGTAPTLPSEVKVLYSDGTYNTGIATWDSVPADKYAHTSTFTVNGTIAGTDIKASVKVIVFGEYVPVKIDKVALQSVITTANAKVEASYTTASWTTFATALSNAKTVEADVEATQEQVDAAKIALVTATEGLVIKSSGNDFADNSTSTNPTIIESQKPSQIPSGIKTTTNDDGTTTTTVTMTYSASTKGANSNAVVANVTVKQLSDAVDKLVAEAQKQGEATVKHLVLKIDVPKDAKSAEASIQKESIGYIVTKGIDRFTVSSTLAKITFDKDAIATTYGNATEDVIITAAKLDVNMLSEQVRQTVGDRLVLDFSVRSGNKTISQFNGFATIAIPYTPKAGEDTDAIVIYYINAEGKAEIVRNSIYDSETGMVTFKTDHFSKYVVGYNKVVFKDVAENAWYANAVSFMAARDITSGTGDGNFSPNGKLSRGQFIVMLMRAYGIVADENPTDNFADAGNTYYTKYVAAANRLGITSGVGDNMFAPDRELNRREMSTLLYNTLKAIDKLPAGNVDKTLEDYDASRGQMAQILYNLLK